MSNPVSKRRLIEAIDEWLPQTQCTQCGYPHCAAYAQAVADGEAEINQCPPGGEVTIRGLAKLLERTPKPLNIDFGVHKARTAARIDEPHCIGCTVCIQVCPVDAIVGAGKRMHTVIEAECTGCELCLPACPVDCIDTLLVSASNGTTFHRWPDYKMEETDRARRRTRARLERLDRQDKATRLEKLHSKARATSDRHHIKEAIAAAVSRVRIHRGNRHHPSDE